MSQSSIGLSQKTAIFISYLFCWISGLLILLLEKENQQVRFHAAQSVVIFGGLTLCNMLSPFIPVIGLVIVFVVSVLSILVWFGMLITTLMERPPRLPIVAQYAEQLEKMAPRIDAD